MIKKSFFRISLFLSFIFLFFSCSFNINSGNVSFCLPGAEKSLERGAETPVNGTDVPDFFTIKLYKDGVENRSVTGNAGETVTIDSLSPGNYIISVEGETDSNYYFDKKHVVVDAGKTTTANFILKDTAPGNVTGLTAIAGDKKVTLNWTNPTDKDLRKIVINYDGLSTPIEIKENVNPGAKMSREITGLTNFIIYTFTVTAVDLSGNKSEGMQTSSTPVIPGSGNKPDVLKNYNGTVTDGTYVTFGIWPQTKYSGTEDNLNECGNGINGWDKSDCYTDGNDYYIRVTATPDSSSNTGFSENSIYYFKLEPIVWRVLTDEYIDANDKKGGKLLLAEKALAAHRYDDDLNNYKNSEIRAYLNGIGTFNNAGFLQKAFTQDQIAAISETMVDNSADSTTDASGALGKATDYACDNTNDRIFLLSEKEVTTSGYGFDGYDKNDTNRQRIPTDYAKATGIWIYGDSGNISWWLRSPDESTDSKNARDVSVDGSAFVYYGVSDTNKGVVPALSISF